MERPNIILTDDARVSIELPNGENITLTIPKDGGTVRFNYSDEHLSILPRVTNEIDIHLHKH